MADKRTLHEQLIDSLFEWPNTPRDFAAVNEIKALRERIAELEKPKRSSRSKKADE